MRSVFLLVILFLSGVPASVSMARDYGQYSDIDPATKNLVKGLTDKKGKSCCETADGHPAEYEWDVSSHGYRVLIEGQWYPVPPEALIEEPNRLGYATVWYWWEWEFDGRKIHHIRCFLPGAGG
jgi:hypothetical protein